MRSVSDTDIDPNKYHKVVIFSRGNLGVYFAQILQEVKW